jgi:hypothetical protein
MSTNPPQFADERFMSASEKLKVLRAWTRFLESGCKWSSFTKDLYNHLIQHCSFIAHYNRQGFYSVYFERPTPGTFLFLDQFDPEKSGRSAEYGTTHWLSAEATGADLNAAMREAALPYLDRLRKQFTEVHRQAEIALVTSLLEKHGLTAVPIVRASDESSECALRTPQAIPAASPTQTQLFTD